MNNMLFSILLILIGLIIGVFTAFLINLLKGSLASKKVEKMLEQAKKDAEKMKRDSILEQKEEMHRLKMETDKEIKERKEEIKEQEARLLQRETNMDKRDEMYQKRELVLDERESKLTDRLTEIQEEKSKVEEIKKEQLELLEKISGFNKNKAKELVMKQVKENMSKEISEYIREQENEAKLTADKTAKEMIVTSMQKYAADIASDQTVTVVELPNEEMKGRIIGREGRNIRTIEAITGVDLIIDDTPEAVVLSSFDPLRREIAYVTLQTLIKDGRIHPTRIEELYDKVSKDMKQKIIEFGNEATFELGLTKFDPALIEIIGKLHFRTSYGQNALQHSIEVAHLSGLIASELGENVVLAKRAGLLHDIGKAIDHEIEGSHVEVGLEIAKRYGRMEDLTKGLLYTYGVVEFDFLRTKICKYMNEIISEEELHDIYFKKLNLNLDVNYYNVRWTNTNEVQQFVTYLDEEEEDVGYIVDAQKSRGLKYKNFKEQEILSRKEYLWNKSTQNFYKYIKSKK